MTVSVRAFVPENLHPHTVLAARNAKGRLTCIGGKYADGAVTATTRTTGELFVVADTLPMQGTLIHLFEEPPARKSHSVRLTLTDACGNTACWEGTIRR